MIEFYNVRKKAKVEIDESNVEVVIYNNTTKTGKKVTRYGVKAVDEDGTKLTKFISKVNADELQAAGISVSTK
tara:strand:+ start:831 stop:1049 length:219 start_codon:yes stop_codon:yes gene_type:complete